MVIFNQFFLVDRRNGKSILNSHTHKRRCQGSNPGRDFRSNNFDILLIELGLVDKETIFKHFKK